MAELRRHAERIYTNAVRRALPDVAVKEALKGFRPGPGRTRLIAVGKAAWRMASAALETIEADGGLVVTKYGHSQGPLPGLEILAAGHPVGRGPCKEPLPGGQGPGRCRCGGSAGGEIPSHVDRAGHLA